MALLKQDDPSEPEKSKHALLRMIERRNQTVVEADLAAFFGPKSEVYLRHYRRLVEKGKHWAISWHWPFLLTGGFGWAFYRRAWRLGASILFILVVILVLRNAGLNVMGVDALVLAMTVHAKNLYVHHGFRWIQRAENLGLVGEARRSFLEKGGGTSRAAGVLAGPWFALLIIAAVASALSGGDRQRTAASMSPTSVSVAGPDLRN